MSKFETVVNSQPECLITLFHDPEDYMSWIVRKWKKQLFWKKCLSSRWFSTRGQAEEYVARLVRECDRDRRTGGR